MYTYIAFLTTVLDTAVRIFIFVYACTRGIARNARVVGVPGPRYIDRCIDISIHSSIKALPVYPWIDVSTHSCINALPEAEP
jgi:hypothetical protein